MLHLNRTMIAKVLSELSSVLHWDLIHFNFHLHFCSKTFISCALFLSSGLCCDLWLILITFPIAILNENYQQTSDFMHFFLFSPKECVDCCWFGFVVWLCISNAIMQRITMLPAQTMCAIMREEQTDLNENWK